MTVSVVIPAKNGVETIGMCLDGILSQTVPVHEIVVIDSGSTDGSLEIIKTYDKVKLVEIAPTDFNHGMTRNLGVSHATGDVVVFTVQDAKAVDEFWIENLLKGLDSDEVVAVCGQQVVPHELDKNPAQWFRPYSEPRITKYSFTEEEFNALSPAEILQACSWDDVTALYRMETLQRLPFRETFFGEDLFWAKDALQAGYTIAYNYAARVYHYHHEDGDLAYRRSFAEIYSRYRCLGMKPGMLKLTPAYYLRLIKLLVKAKGLTLMDRIKWWKYNIQLESSFNKAVTAFETAFAKGDEALEQLYFETCNIPPSPDNSKKNSFQTGKRNI